MKRLFGCTAQVEFIYENERVQPESVHLPRASTDRGEFWWDPRASPKSRCLWDSKIRLGEEFFHEIIQHPVPLDMNTLKALKRCALGLDLYLWLTYRTFALHAPLRLPWLQVYRQFGPNPNNASDNDTVQAFRYKVLRELKKIKMAWPGLNYTTAPGVLILLPSTPAIAPLNQGQLQARLPFPASQRPISGLAGRVGPS